MKEKVNFVQEFAEVGEYFDRPVSGYSSGMRARLAFNPVLHLVELSRSMGVEGYEPFKYLSPAYPVTLALTLTAVGLMLYRLRFLARVTP